MVDEYHKDMETFMMRANLNESEEKAMTRFLHGLNHPIKRIVDSLPYDSLVALVHQAKQAELQVMEDAKHDK